jgi:mRNA interferase MazF
VADYIPDRGDIVWLTWTPQAGHEQAGRRPAVVLSPRAYNARVGLALFCPVTSKEKGYPFEARLPADIPVAGVVLTDQVKSLDWRARRAELLARLSPESVNAVAQKLIVLIEG